MTREEAMKTAKTVIECKLDKDGFYQAALEAMRDANDARNELCLRCGNYREAHKGACNGCRWANK